MASTNAPANESYNLAFLPADAKMVVAVRPQTLLQRREVRTLLESIKQSAAFKGVLVVPPEDVEQFLVFWEGIPQAPVNPAGLRWFRSLRACVLRMSKPRSGSRS